VRDKVDAWLARELPGVAAMPFECDGYPRYEPFPAALKVLYEFGGLTSLADGRGRTGGADTVFDLSEWRFDDLGRSRWMWSCSGSGSGSGCSREVTWSGGWRVWT
jgi:hypothetical protein